MSHVTQPDVLEQLCDVENVAFWAGDEIRRLREEIERLRTDYSVLKTDYDALRAEVERLRAALDQIAANSLDAWAVKIAMAALEPKP